MITFFLYAFFISILILLLVIFLTKKYQLFIDHATTNKPQNFHTDNTPRAGGIGILSGMFLIVLFPFGIKFFFSLILAFISGIFEDFHNSLSPKFRLLLQLLAALSAVFLTDAVVTYLGLGIVIPYWIGIIFSTFAIVGMMNAINIIDGFNGLASGIILLILISFGIVSYQQSDNDILSIIVITAGTTFGFFLLNFPKGKIFLGDGGAYLLGFIVALIGIFLASTYEDISPWYIIAIFIYPVWEVLFSIIRKLYIGISPLSPDSYHLHMLIYRQLTKNNPLTTLFILSSSLPFMIFSTFYHNSSKTNIAISACFIVCYLVLYYLLYKKDMASKKNSK